MLMQNEEIRVAKEKARRDLYIEYREHHEATIRSIAGLLYILHGIEKIADQNPIPTISTLKTYPTIPSHIKKDMFQNNGDVLRIAFKGWVDEVYQINEAHRHRVASIHREKNKITKLHPDDYIPPEEDFLGDFRRIRNDFIHSGRASEEWTGKCKILKWFTPPGKIVFSMDHVLEYLIRTHLIHYETDLGREYVWKLKEETENIFVSPYIKLLAIRINTDEDGINNSKRNMMACVFSDGVFGMGEVEFISDSEDFLKGEINSEGDIFFPSGQIIKSRELYEHCLRTLKKGDWGKRKGMFGPFFRFRR